MPQAAGLLLGSSLGTVQLTREVTYIPLKMREVCETGASEITGSEEARGTLFATLLPRVLTQMPVFRCFSLSMNASSTNCPRDYEILRSRCSLSLFVILDFL